MRQAPLKVQQVITPVVAALGYELLGVEYVSQGHAVLRVYIDSAEGIGVKDCERVSHQLSGVLDVEEPLRGHYQLEVSSPGLDRPLFVEAHFQSFAGHEATVKLAAPMDGKRKLRGILQGMDDQDVLLMVDGETLAIPLMAIDKANLVPE